VAVVDERAGVGRDARGQWCGERAVAVVEGGEGAVGVVVVPAEGAVWVLGRLQPVLVVVGEAVAVARRVGQAGHAAAVVVGVGAGVVGVRRQRAGRGDMGREVAVGVVAGACFGAGGIDAVDDAAALVV